MKRNLSYTECIRICEKALDLLDIRKFLIKDKTAHDIIWDIEDYYNDPINNDTYMLEYFMKEYPEIFGEEDPQPFNYMTDDEFITYCEKRYPDVSWGHEWTERHWVLYNGINN